MIAATHNAPPAFLWPVLLVAIPCWFCFLMWVMATASGWRRMARKFPLTAPIEGAKTTRVRSAQVGWVNYNNCLTIQIGPAGIALRMRTPFSLFSPPLLLPWSALSEPRTRKFLWMERVEFDVGQPPIGRITLPKQIFADGSANFTKTAS